MTHKKDDPEFLKAQMQTVGVTLPEHHAIAQHAVAAGVDRGQLLDWLRRFGPSIFDVIKKLLELQGGTTPPATTK